MSWTTLAQGDACCTLNSEFWICMDSYRLKGRLFSFLKGQSACLSPPLSAGQVASLTGTCFMDRMLGSCAGHHRLWPLTSPLFHWQHQSDCLISVMPPPFYPMTAQFTRCDVGFSGVFAHSWGLAVRFHSPSLIMDSFDGRLPCITAVMVISEQDGGIQKLGLWKGNLPHDIFEALSIIPPLYNFGEAWFLFFNNQFIFWLLWPCSWLLCSVSGQERRSVIVFGSYMVEGPTDTTTAGLRLQLCPPPASSSFSSPSSKMKETAAVLVGFYPAFPSLSTLFSPSLFTTLHMKQLIPQF